MHDTRVGPGGRDVERFLRWSLGHSRGRRPRRAPSSRPVAAASADAELRRQGHAHAVPDRRPLLQAALAPTNLAARAGHRRHADRRRRARSCRPAAGRSPARSWTSGRPTTGAATTTAGFRLRGHQFADEQGRYRLETVVPGLYPGRTRHFHVRVQAPNQPILTTQLYFPDEPGNRSDFIFRPELVMAVRDEAGAKAGAFNFVLAVLTRNGRIADGTCREGRPHAPAEPDDLPRPPRRGAPAALARGLRRPRPGVRPVGRRDRGGQDARRPPAQRHGRPPVLRLRRSCASPSGPRAPRTRIRRSRPSGARTPSART